MKKEVREGYKMTELGEIPKIKIHKVAILYINLYNKSETKRWSEV